MRTTVTLDADLAKKLKDYARRQRTSFKEALNGVLRRGLAAQSPPAGRRRFVVRPHGGVFRPGIGVGRLNQLVDELENAEFLRASHSEE